MGAVALFALLLAGLLDEITGKDFSFTLLYLVPISIAVWFVGPSLALVLCFLAAASGMVVELVDKAPFPAALWNAGIRFGVYLVVYLLLSYLREHKAAGILAPQTRKLIAMAACITSLPLVAAGFIQYGTTVKASLDGTSAASHNRLADQSPLAELAFLLQQSLRSSRPLLLGSRDPSGPSCIQISHTSDIKGVMPENQGDLDGGPGTSMAVLYFYDRQGIKSPLEDFKWHQSRLRNYLENNIAVGDKAEEVARASAEKASLFLDAADSWSASPADVSAIGFTKQDDWPSYCLAALNKAIREQDLSATKYWAAELAAATFWLEDLLRWRSFLYKNQLAALNFQARCESLFVAAEHEHLDYKPETTMSQFPAGLLGLNGKGNYYEVERQAEQLFSVPAERLLAIEENKPVTPNVLWVPPTSREVFLRLRSALSANNQNTWDLAARTPYQHGYLVNILFRARTAKLVDDLTAVLKTLDARNPHANINELMGVLMYRGHSFAGLEWGDRFQPQLTAAAANIKTSETDLAALQDAWAWTNHFYQSPAEYGVTFTLRDSLEQKKLDCVRATDMIAAIFRNAGRARLGHVRWCCETSGHSVAAYLGSDNAQTKPLLADGLIPPHKPDIWPDCYFRGHAWPPGLEANKPPYAMELYLRGIDSYVWAQGYIVRGPNAGWLITTSIPYSTQYSADSNKKVYEGPYPE
jgi:hypothetical protein